MKLNNKKGFTLIELMVVVGIIGIITGIAIPSFQKFQARAKQANAKTELSGLYGMEKAFYTEFGHYHANLPLVGYVPDGYPADSTNADCPASGSISAGGTATRYYEIGFNGATGAGKSAVDSVPSGIGGGSVPCPGIDHYEATLDISALTGPATAAMAEDSFVAVANGKVSNSTKADAWTMNNNKLLTNEQIGY